MCRWCGYLLSTVAPEGDFHYFPDPRGLLSEGEEGLGHWRSLLLEDEGANREGRIGFRITRATVSDAGGQGEGISSTRRWYLRSLFYGLRVTRRRMNSLPLAGHWRTRCWNPSTGYDSRPARARSFDRPCRRSDLGSRRCP